MNQQALRQYDRKTELLLDALHCFLFYCRCCCVGGGASVGHHVMTTPAPHAGLAVVAALNILEGFNITSQMLRNSTYHRTAEVMQMQCPPTATLQYSEIYFSLE